MSTTVQKSSGATMFIIVASCLDCLKVQLSDFIWSKAVYCVSNFGGHVIDQRISQRSSSNIASRCSPTPAIELQLEVYGWNGRIEWIITNWLFYLHDRHGFPLLDKLYCLRLTTSAGLARDDVSAVIPCDSLTIVGSTTSITASPTSWPTVHASNVRTHA